MNDSSHENRYRARFLRVLSYVDAHLDDSLDIAVLAEVAAFSPFHFQRQFSAMFGISIGRYVQLQRLRQASLQLAFRENAVTDVALSGGYEAAEAFSRAFRRQFGVSPTMFREEPDWFRWHEAFDPLQRAGVSTDMDFSTQLQIENTDTIAVGVLAHRGDPRTIGDSIRRFIAWRKANGLAPQRSRTFNVFHTPPDVDPGDYRMDLCAEVRSSDVSLDEGMALSSIPGGRIAVVHHRGPDTEMAAAFHWLYAVWLPQSGEEMRDFPPYLERLSFYPDVPEAQAEWRAALPLR